MLTIPAAVGVVDSGTRKEPDWAWDPVYKDMYV